MAVLVRAEDPGHGVTVGSTGSPEALQGRSGSVGGGPVVGICPVPVKVSRAVSVL